MTKSKNVQKRKARPKRSIANPGDDHNAGLWIDYDLLRKHHSHTIIHDPLTATNNRYLELADVALGDGRNKKTMADLALGDGRKWKRKTKAATAE